MGKRHLKKFIKKNSLLGGVCLFKLTPNPINLKIYLMTSLEIRQKFLDFFVKKGHKILPPSSLIPEDDPSVLLTTAGMQQFKKWFSGIEEPKYKRVATIQKCVRVDDIEEVGDETHFSFFEMMGNFSFGDYFKEEAIVWAIDFLTQNLGIDFQRLSFSYFKGERELAADKESLDILYKLKIPPRKIKSLGKEDNFWGPTGDEGPCGPTVEIYVDGVEVWNLVFNEYYRNSEGEYRSLKFKGVDTGLGFERLVSILAGTKSPYETDLFFNINSKIWELEGKPNIKAERVVADHLRASVFLLAEGVLPSNLDRGYILRRLIRRAIRYGRILGIKGNFTSKVAKAVVDNYQEIYPQLASNREKILEELDKEEERFQKTLQKGLSQFKKISQNTKELTGKEVFDLFQTYGFPLEMTQELASEQGIKIDKRGFEEEFRKHQQISRKGLDKRFKGGLATGGLKERKYHTATHLLHQALRIVLGDWVKQAGSNITSQRLRFDFIHPKKLTPEEISQVEDLVNEKIKARLPVTMEEISLDEARRQGAIGIFDKKYGDRVRVYSIGDFSKEICGGPHVDNTGQLGYFKIIKEQSSSAGVRRIKAILIENKE